LTLSAVGSAATFAQEGPEFVDLLVSAQVDSDPSRRGESLEATSANRAISRISMRWTSGVTARVRRSTRSSRPQVFARVVVLTADLTRLQGSLRIPAGRSTGRFELDATENLEVTATLRTGPQPSLVLRDLPPQTRLVVLRTAGWGSDVFRKSGPCVERRVGVRGSVAVSFADRSATRHQDASIVTGCIPLDGSR